MLPAHLFNRLIPCLLLAAYLVPGVIACSDKPNVVGPPTPAESTPAQATPAQAGVTSTASPSAPFPNPVPDPVPLGVIEPSRYRRLPAPLIPRAASDETSLLEGATGFQTGTYRVEYDGKQFLIYDPEQDTALSLALPIGDDPVFGANPEIRLSESDSGEEISLTGQNEWGDFQITLYAYNYHPGLVRWRVEMVPHGDPPANPQPELQFVDRTTGEETAGKLEIYADRAPMAAPHLYGYSQALDSTLFYWVDLTALNPFMDAAHYTPAATPRRQGQRLGHTLSQGDLSRQPAGVAVTVFDSYLYLTPGKPAGEDAMFTRYLHNLGDVYDLMAVPDDPLPAWFDIFAWDGQGIPDGIHRGTIRDLADERNWVTLEGKRYLRAYVSDTRQSAEAISQLDVLSALTRYEDRFDEKPDYYDELRATVPDFFNPDIGPAGMFQNSGPLQVTGPQGRGDTWYELGHALKVAELALWRPEDTELRELALRSGETWIDFARTADYRFPQFYSFDTWQGTGLEPDAGGGYAYFMMLLHQMTGESHFLDEARNALQALDGYGFRLSYETHMTAITAAAAARLYEIEPDPLYLDIVNRAVANLMRLSWIWESDYGSLKEDEDAPPSLQAESAQPSLQAESAQPSLQAESAQPSLQAESAQPGSLDWWQGPVRQRTFFGLNPTQQSAAITAKEQYEAWIYLLETLQRLHGQLDPTVEKLIAEFAKHTLLTIPRSLPLFLPPESVTIHPAAYETVTENVLSLMIPLEDLRDGWDISGAIGQEVYGAGMAPALAALALVEVAPGIVLYSGYPVVAINGQEVTFAGIAGTHAPVAVTGVTTVLDAAGLEVETVSCGTALCFMAEGGRTYQLERRPRRD